MLVLDADKTLAGEDSGALFWQQYAKSFPPDANLQSEPLKELFSSPLGYSYAAFEQAAMLYEEAGEDGQFEDRCDAVSYQINMYHDFVSFLRFVEHHEHVGAVVVTCGPARVWEKVLLRANFPKVRVIGGRGILSESIVTPEVKALLFSRLQNMAGLDVWAFGDSPLDLPMLKKADQTIVVVGKQATRSASMEDALAKAIDAGGFFPRQVLCQSDATPIPPRLDTTRLPLVSLSDASFREAVTRTRALHFLHSTGSNAAKLLMSPMRDASVAGPDLRRAHIRVGEYLATHFVSQMIGLEDHPIPHVQGRQTIGHRLQSEQKTSIVALMRGGEPMALGVNNIFPKAIFIHAAAPSDIKWDHLKYQRTVILVDSVINSGETLMEFIRYIRGLHGHIRIIVVAGVVQ